MQAQNQYLDFLIDPSFQGVNRLLVLSFEDNVYCSVYTIVYDSKKSKFIKKHLGNVAFRSNFVLET